METHKLLSKMPVVICAVLVAAAMWGGGFTLIKLGYEVYGIDAGGQLFAGGVRRSAVSVFVCKVWYNG